MNFKILFILATICIVSCTSKKNDPTTDCSSTSIVVTASTTTAVIGLATGSITITAPINTEYTYKINNGSYQVSPVFSNLAAGSYTITAKNAAGCTGAVSVTITSFNCSSTFINVDAEVSASTATTGTLNVVDPIGSNYSYSINGGAYQSSTFFNNLTSGSYTITAKNENGCTGSHVFTVYGCNTLVSGTDTGQHTVYAGSVALPLSKIHDVLNPSLSGSSITIHSTALNMNLHGTQNSGDCNNYQLDSIIFVMGDTLRIATTLPGLGGFVKISDVRAGGTATFNSNGFNTQINIVSGHTNIASPIDLTTISPSLGLNLKGIFIKYP